MHIGSGSEEGADPGAVGPGARGDQFIERRPTQAKTGLEWATRLVGDPWLEWGTRGTQRNAKILRFAQNDAFLPITTLEML